MDEEFERELGAFDADENNEDVDDEDSEFSQSGRIMSRRSLTMTKKVKALIVP